jgi:hypothetical protein
LGRGISLQPPGKAGEMLGRGISISAPRPLKFEDAWKIVLSFGLNYFTDIRLPIANAKL